jgi:hypothetical protein
MHIYNTLEIIVIVSADKVPYNIVFFVCKSHYIDGLIKELGIDNVMNLFSASQRISCSHGSSNCHRLKIKQVKPCPPSEKCDCLLSSKRTVRYSLHLHQPLYT